MRSTLTAILLILLCCTGAEAQLCQGSLGDPIVNIDFGAGSNPGPPVRAAGTGYQYVAKDCPNDGFYTVRSRTDRCFGGWHTLASDHTGNPNGYFMLVNASNQPSDFYVDTVDLFCSNTTYEFAAWIINMNGPSECSGNLRQPNLTFSIEKTDGTVLQTYNSGNLPPSATAAWKQYGFFFNTPSGISRIVLRITNNAQGGCGNDLALDDITFRPCGPLLSSTIVGNGNTKHLCEGEAAQVQMSCSISPGYTDPYMQWQQSTDGRSWTDIPGENAAALTRNYTVSTLPGTYLYRLSVAKTENRNIAACRVNSGVLTVIIAPQPHIALKSNGPVCAGSQLQLVATGADQYAWTGPDGFTGAGSPVTINNVQPSQAGMYQVTARTAAGCTGTDSTAVAVNPSPQAGLSPAETTLCEGEAVQLHGSGGGQYAWLPATGLSSSNLSDPVARPADTINYALVVTNEFLCRDTAFAQVNVLARPKVNAGPDKTLLRGQSVHLQASASGSDISYSWSPPDHMDDPSLLQPAVSPVQDISYSLTAISNGGCGTASDTVFVRVFKGIFVPTAFTPNGDGLNDYWKVPGLDTYEHEIHVYNRWGQIVYHARNDDRGWDGRSGGKPLPTGTYPYLITIKPLQLRLTGLVTIIR